MRSLCYLNRATVIVAMLICAIYGAEGQTFFKTFNGSVTDEGGNAMIDAPDGNFFIGGYCGDSALVMKVDPFGTVIWARTFDAHPSYRDVVWQLAITPDNYLIGSGNGIGGSPAISRSIFAFKFDLNGTMQWIQRSNTGTGPYFSRGMLPLNSAGYVLVNGFYNTTSAPYSDPILQGVDPSTGTITWSAPRYDYVPGQSYVDDVYAGVLGNGQSIYTTGRSYLEGSSGGSMRPFITKYDGAGIEQWTKFYVAPASADARVYGIDIIHAHDSLTLCYFGDIQQFSANYKVGLIHTDTLGNFVWGKNYDIAEFSAEVSFKVLRMPYGYAITGTGTGASNDLFAIGVSLQGDLLWAKGYGGPDTEDIYSTVTKNAVASGSDILFTGRGRVSGQEHVVLARVDPQGNMDCGNHYDLDVDVSDVPPFAASLDPVPQTDAISFQASSPAHPYAFTDGCTDPGAFLGEDLATCAPVVLDASDLNANTYLWQDGSTQPSLTASGPGTYWVQVTTNCCTFRDTVIVLSASLPQAAFVVDPSPCSPLVQVENTSLNAVSFLWNFGDGWTSTDVEPGHTYATAGPYTVTCIATNGCGSDTLSSSIDGLAVVSLTIAGPDTICANMETIYSALLEGASSTSIQWSTTASDADSIVFTTGTDSVLNVTVVGDNGCTYSTEHVVSVRPGPEAGFTYTIEDCGALVELTDASLNTTAWAWDLGNGFSSTEGSPTAQYQDQDTAVIRLIASNTCGDDTTVIELALRNTGSIALDGPPLVCPEASTGYTVTLAGTGISDVQWSSGGSTANTQFSTPSDTTLFVNVIGDDGCNYSDSIRISVLPDPLAAFTYALGTCDSIVRFADTSQGATSWQWQLGNGQTSDVSDPIATYPTAGVYNVQLIVSGDCGADSVSAPVRTGALGVFSIIGPTVVCQQEPVTFSARLNGATLDDVVWSTGDTSLTMQITIVDDMTITASGMGSDGCIYSGDLAIRVIGDDGEVALYIPNVFTPNGDGLNEQFAPVILDGFLELTIFNRWGQQIYWTDDQARAWDGTYKGSRVPDGTYVYVVKWRNTCQRTNEIRTGHVTVLR